MEIFNFCLLLLAVLTCFACTVLLGEVPRYSCLTLAIEAQGAHAVTMPAAQRPIRHGQASP